MVYMNENKVIRRLDINTLYIEMCLHKYIKI